MERKYAWVALWTDYWWCPVSSVDISRTADSILVGAGAKTDVKDSFQYTGYHSVFAVAIGLLGVDTILRLLMADSANDDIIPISDNVRAVDSEDESHEEQPLLQASDAAKKSYKTCDSDSNMEPIHENESATDSPGRARSAFGILLCYPRTATIVAASVMNAGILASFETVRSHYS